MRLLPRDRFQQTLFLLFLVFLAASCVKPPFWDYLLLQHVPTGLAAMLLAWLSSRFEISRLSFASIILFLALHTLGARHLYSYTPYDAWCEALCGFNISRVCGFTRNHYDRLVHFAYGLLLAIPIQEFERRHLKLSPGLSSVLAVECILATSAAYELLEWGIAVVFTPAWAESFLGQQGDPFDAHKDMALATAGALLSTTIAAVARRWQAMRGNPPKIAID